MRYPILFIAALVLAGCSGESSDYVLGDGTYTETELRQTWRDLIAFDSGLCPAVRALETDEEVIDYINSLAAGYGEKDDSFQEPKDADRAIALLRSMCG